MLGCFGRGRAYTDAGPDDDESSGKSQPAPKTPQPESVEPIKLAGKSGHQLRNILLQNPELITSPELSADKRFWLACEINNSQIVKAGLSSGERKANAVVNEDGDQIIHIASAMGYVDLLDFVLSKMDPGTQKTCSWGESPLILATMNGRTEVAKRLLALGANVKTTNSSGETAVYISSYFGHIEILKDLIRRGANAMTPNQEGLRPIDIAMSRGHKNCHDEILGWMRYRRVKVVLAGHLKNPGSPFASLPLPAIKKIVRFM